MEVVRSQERKMNSNEQKLGLPIEYQQMPEHFDAHTINEQTEAKRAKRFSL